MSSLLSYTYLCSLAQRCRDRIEVVSVVKSMGRKQLQILCRIPHRWRFAVIIGRIESNCWDMTCGFVVVMVI
ncbi:hypothetical protein HanIR_Chr04g0168081 [Helianthus annuus]|nr:hypothetical protein HanIR_Chr04g0168081 [Helianthus annuus]